MLVGSSHDRNAGQGCPAQSGGHRYWATVPTYDGKTGQATCAQPSFSRAQWDSLLEMIYAVGCDGVFYWATATAGASISRTRTSLEFAGLLDLAARLDGAAPQGNHTATFYTDRGPFAG